MKKTGKKNRISSKTYRMYHRMKNILGASLVILAIVIAQIPMPDVSAEGNTVKFDTLIAGWTVADAITSSQGVATEPNVISINGSQEELALRKEYTYHYNADDNNLAAIETKYIFGGWYTDTSFYQSVDFTKQVAEDVTYYAKWTTAESKNYTVTFSSAGVSNSTEFPLRTFTTDEDSPLQPVSKPTTTPQSTSGLTFQSWQENGATEEYDWTKGITRNIILYATWQQPSGVNVTFDYNGGEDTNSDPKATSTIVNIAKGDMLTDGQFPDEGTNPITYVTDKITYSTETGVWYRDATALNVHVDRADSPQTVSFDTDTTVYKKWFFYTLDGITQNTENEGFCLNPGGRVLYSFVRPASVQDIIIPEGVRTIGPEAFPQSNADLLNLKSIQLPTTITDIQENAFSFANNLTEEVSIIAPAGSSTATQFARTLAEKYENLVYESTAGGGTEATEVTFQVLCSLNDVNNATNSSGATAYPTATPPGDLPNGEYYLTLSEDGVQDLIDNLLATDSRTSALDQSTNVYFMDISLTKQNSTDPVTFSASMSITMPIPSTWQSKNSEYIDVFCVSSDGSTLEKVTDFITTIDGVPAIGFYPRHFSEYALVYQALAAGESYTVTVNNGSGSGAYSPGTTVTVTANAAASGYTFSGWTTSGTAITLSSTTSTTATFTMPSGSVTVTANYTSDSGGGSSGDDSGGSSGGSGGSSSSGGHSSSSGSSSSGSSSSGSSGSSGGASSLDALAGLANGTIGAGGTTGGVGGTGGISGTGGTGNSSSTGGSGASHTKDSTPKTGDPLEYKTLFVCGCFSLGVLLLLTGNKKKAFPAS